jgi:hypothetical protein
MIGGVRLTDRLRHVCGLMCLAFGADEADMVNAAS